METLLQGMLSRVGEQGIEKIGKSVGLDSEKTKTLLDQSGRLLFAKMADNTKSQEGRKSLNTALKNHNESIFQQLDDVVNPAVDTKGSKILDKILGENSKKLAGVLAKKNNINSSSAQKVIEMAAPLILGELGYKKKIGSLDAGGIFDILQGEKKSSGNSMIMDLAEQFLDKDGDGSVVDDLIGIAGKFLKK